MTKNELIAKYGIAWYNELIAKNRAKQNAKYKNDSEWRNKRSKSHAKLYANNQEVRETVKANAKARYDVIKDSEEYKNKRNNYVKNRRKSDPEFRNKLNLACGNWHKSRYVRDGRYDLIENYELAKADNFEGWLIHHRLELTLDNEFAHTPEELQRLNMYFDRPPYELIWLKLGEHSALHNCKRGKKC